MRRLFLILILFTLSSSRRIHRRSEDVDPLLKELFGELKAPVPKDRRDGQTAGDLDAGSGSSGSDPAAVDDTSLDGSGGGGEGSDSVDDKALPAKDSPPAEKDDKALPAKDSPPAEKDDDKALPAKDSPPAEKEEDKALPAKDSPPAEKEEDKALPAKDSPPAEKEDDKALPAKDSPPAEKEDDKALPAKDSPPAEKEDDKAGPGGSDDDNASGDSSEDSELLSSGGGESVSDDTSSAVVTDNKSLEPSSQDTAEETKSEPAGVTAEQNPAVASSELASVSEQSSKNSESVPDVTAPMDQSDQTSESATASVNPVVATNVLPAEKQEVSVPSNQDADVTAATSQSTNTPNVVETARADIPDAVPASNDVVPNTKNVAEQSNDDMNMRSNIPQAPAAVTQPWPAVNKLPVAPQSGSLGTNENTEFVKKDTIPAAPRQPGASSYPLQLNKHSPGAELMKRFFISKKQAKKRKEEEAKQKSLIGDGKYTVSPNDGYYKYAAAPVVPPPNLNGLEENGKLGTCVDKYDSCPEFARNHYCTDYKNLMKVQCKKSCKFCGGDDDDEDDEDGESEESVKANDEKKEEKIKNDDDDDEDDEDSKTHDNDEERKKDDKISKHNDKDNDDDDDDDDDDDHKQASSGSEKHLDDDSSAPENKDIASSGSGSDSPEQFQDISTAPSNDGSGSGQSSEDLPPTAEEFEDEDGEEKAHGSGSGSDDNGEDDDSDELAKDLAEQELFSNKNVKKNTIPNPSVPAAPAVYPKIDLKDIARYVSLYRRVAKKLFGEALDSARKEFVAQQSKRSDIPVPIKEKLKTETKDSSGSLEGFYSSQAQKKRGDIPMNPNNAVYTPKDETWANRAYKEAESYLRSKIPEFKNYAPPAMFNYPFYINDPNKKVKETNEGSSSKKSEIPENPEERYNKTLQDILKRDHINGPSTDPYEYLRNMIPGSSMKPIASKNGITYVPDTFSRPIQLRTKSQWLDILAKKKSAIPKAPQTVAARPRSSVSRPVASVPHIQTKPEAEAAQVTQYSLPQPEAANNIDTSNASPQSTNAGQPQPESASIAESSNVAPQTTSSVIPQTGVVRSEVPQAQPELQQVPAAQDANFLQSNEAVDQAPSFSEVESRSKDQNKTLAASPLAREDRQTHHKDSTH